MTESDPDVFLTVRKLAMVSMMEVLKDIIPGYRIRLPTEAEKAAKVITQLPENYRKKDTTPIKPNIVHYLLTIDYCYLSFQFY